MNLAEAGNLIRMARRQAGLTQAALAKHLRMSRATISLLENGVITELGVRKLGQVCDRLGLEVVVQPKRPLLTLHEAYARNKQQRQSAFKETDAIIAKLNSSGDTHG